MTSAAVYLSRDRRTPERVFHRQVVQLARLRGWWCHHAYDSRRSEAGLPDLLLIRPPRLLWRELKREDGKLSPEQAAVLAALVACGQDAKVWRPSDFEQILEELA